VHVVDAGVRGQVRADVAAAAEDPQEPRFDQRRQSALVHRNEPVLSRVDLEDHHAIVREEFVEHVEHRDGGDVAGAEHEPDAAAARTMPLAQARRRARVHLGHTRLEPDLARIPRQQQPVHSGEGEGVRPQTPAGRGIHPQPVQRARTPGEGLDAAPVRGQGDEDRVGSAQPLLAAQRMCGAHALRQGGGLRPFLRVGGRRRVEALQQARSLVERQMRPRTCADAELGDRGVEPRRFLRCMSSRLRESRRCGRGFHEGG
jgi:hypothetical protein